MRELRSHTHAEPEHVSALLADASQTGPHRGGDGGVTLSASLV
jgi:hypothetical protein